MKVKLCAVSLALPKCSCQNTNLDLKDLTLSSQFQVEVSTHVTYADPGTAL